MAKSIRQELVRALERTGLTYEEFGQLVGLSKSSVCKKLNGETKIGLAELERFARVLKVKVQVRSAS